MRLILEQEDTHWTTTVSKPLGNIRWLAIKLGDKLFHVRREIDSMSMYMDQEAAKNEIDKLLIREMEHMLLKVIQQAAAKVPDGPIDLM